MTDRAWHIIKNTPLYSERHSKKQTTLDDLKHIAFGAVKQKDSSKIDLITNIEISVPSHILG